MACLREPGLENGFQPARAEATSDLILLVCSVGDCANWVGECAAGAPTSEVPTAVIVVVEIVIVVVDEVVAVGRGSVVDVVQDEVGCVGRGSQRGGRRGLRV